MLPDMSDVLDEFSQPLITLIRVSQDIVDFRPVDNETDVPVEAVIQPANKEKINPTIIDWALDYQLVHSRQEILVGDQMVYCGTKYKAVELGPYQDYGFSEAIFEEIK